MIRNTGSGMVPDKLGPGKPGFSNGNPQQKGTGSRLADIFMDHLQEEIANLVEKMGGSLDAGVYDQVFQALEARYAKITALTAAIDALKAEVLIPKAVAELRMNAGEPGQPSILPDGHGIADATYTGAGGIILVDFDSPSPFSSTRYFPMVTLATDQDFIASAWPVSSQQFRIVVRDGATRNAALLSASDFRCFMVVFGA